VQCAKTVRPKTRMSDVKAQILAGCVCGGTLRWFNCEAQSYWFVMKVDGVEYSIWAHVPDAI
jgi:hypothetical protein